MASGARAATRRHDRPGRASRSRRRGCARAPRTRARPPGAALRTTTDTGSPRRTGAVCRTRATRRVGVARAARPARGRTAPQACRRALYNLRHDLQLPARRRPDGARPHPRRPRGAHPPHRVGRRPRHHVRLRAVPLALPLRVLPRRGRAPRLARREPDPDRRSRRASSRSSRSAAYAIAPTWGDGHTPATTRTPPSAPIAPVPRAPAVRAGGRPFRTSDCPRMTTIRARPASPVTAAPRHPSLHQPRAVVAGLQRPRPPRGPRRAQPAPGAGEVPGDLRLQPRRVLPGPRLRADGAGRRREREALVRRADRGRAAGRHPRAGPRPGRSSRAGSSARSAPAWRREGVAIVDHAAIPEHHARLRERYLEEIFPVLTPLAVAPGHPFPYISTLSLSLAITVADPVDGRAALRPGQGPADPAAPGRGDSARVYVPLEQVIAANLDALFPGVEVVEAHMFRVTRDADFDVEEDEAGDLLSAIEQELRRRRFGSAVRLEVEEHDARDDAGVPPVRDRPRRRRPLRSPGHARPDVASGRSPRSTSRSCAIRPGRRSCPPGSSRPTRASTSDVFAVDPAGRPPRPPPVRVVHRVGRALHHPGRRRPGRPLDQADALPDVGRLADRARPDPGRRPGQAGRRARRDQGPLRRGGEHRLGAQARAGGRPRRLRPGRPQDAQQGGPRRAPRGHRPAPLPPPRDRQLQPEDGAPLHRPRAAHLPSRARRRRHRPLQLPDRPLPPGRVPAPPRRPDHAPAPDPRPHRPRDGPRPGRPAGADRGQGQRPGGSRDDRAPLRGEPGGRRDRLHRPRRLQPPPRASRGRPSGSASARSSASSSSTAGSSASPTAGGRSGTRARPT